MIAFLCSLSCTYILCIFVLAHECIVCIKPTNIAHLAHSLTHLSVSPIHINYMLIRGRTIPTLGSSIFMVTKLAPQVSWYQNSKTWPGSLCEDCEDLSSEIKAFSPPITWHCDDGPCDFVTILALTGIQLPDRKVKLENFLTSSRSKGACCGCNGL